MSPNHRSRVDWLVRFGLFAREDHCVIRPRLLKLAGRRTLSTIPQLSAVKRAAKEGFKVSDFDACAQIKEQYRIPAGIVYTEFTQRQLVGLSKFASDEEVTERCIQFAKAVAYMERMSHHARHVYVCQKAQFNADKSGRYFLTSDANGKGVIEHLGGSQKLHPIPAGQAILLRGWQIFNQGDGCIIVGMSKSGTFSFRGGVTIIE